MPRIPFVASDLSSPPELVAAMRQRRGGSLNDADRMVLNAPIFAYGWNELATCVRHRLGLSAKLRELAICGVGVLNGSEFEVDQHAPEFLRSGGTNEQLEALRDFTRAASDTALFDASERAVMQLTIEMTRNVAVDERTFEAVRSQLSSTEDVVEVIGVIAFYNMVSRFLVALDVQ